MGVICVGTQWVRLCVYCDTGIMGHGSMSRRYGDGSRYSTVNAGSLSSMSGGAGVYGYDPVYVCRNGWHWRHVLGRAGLLACQYQTPGHGN